MDWLPWIISLSLFKVFGDRLQFALFKKSSYYKILILFHLLEMEYCFLQKIYQIENSIYLITTAISGLTFLENNNRKQKCPTFL